MQNSLDRYNQHLNKITRDLSKTSSDNINRELTIMANNPHISSAEKYLIKDRLYSKLSPAKKLANLSHFGRNRFGETSPQTQAAMTQAAVTQAVAAASQAAGPNIPGFVPATLPPAATLSPIPQTVYQVPQTMPQTMPQVAQVAGTVPTADYNDGVAALQAAANAIQLAGQALAAQGVSGFGRYRRRF